MSKVKIFLSVESEYTEMERDINHWLETTKPKIISIQGNIAPQTPSSGGMIKDTFGSSDLFVIILYESE
jgi:hypothetical protein